MTKFKTNEEYILNDLALSSLVTRNLYSQNADCEDKEELENQIKLIMQENTNLRIQISAREEKYRELEREFQELKLINKEYERLDNGNKRGFTITSVKQYNIDELLKREENWNELKEFLETNWKETQDIWFVKIINKMQELERGVSDVED